MKRHLRLSALILVLFCGFLLFTGCKGEFRLTLNRDTSGIISFHSVINDKNNSFNTDLDALLGMTQRKKELQKVEKQLQQRGLLIDGPSPTSPFSVSRSFNSLAELTTDTRKGNCYSGLTIYDEHVPGGHWVWLCVRGWNVDILPDQQDANAVTQAIYQHLGNATADVSFTLPGKVNGTNGHFDSKTRRIRWDDISLDRPMVMWATTRMGLCEMPLCENPCEAILAVIILTALLYFGIVLLVKTARP